MIDSTINDDKTIVGGEDMILAGRYHILRRLGQGGMGAVWLAEDRQLDNRKVAIKMLPSIVVTDKRAYQQLKSEALVSLKLIHPNIVTLRAFEENNGAPFLVMDYIEGRTLSDYLAEKGKLSEAETIKLLKPIAAALDYAHGEKVIHRDVKPSNIIIRNDGHPFVLDFGIAREIQESMTRVTGRTISGTLLYMSPEQLRGAPPAPAQDVYSFAAMCYECLSGNPPFARGEIAYQILNVLPTPLPKTLRIAPKVMLGLAKRIDKRPKTCIDIIAEQIDANQKSIDLSSYGQMLSKQWVLCLIGGACIIGMIILGALINVGESSKEGGHTSKLTESASKTGGNLKVEAKSKVERTFQRNLLAAKAGDTNAMEKVLIGYAYGVGVTQNVNMAIQWGTKLAKTKSFDGLTRLSLALTRGDGVTKDVFLAKRCLEICAENGDASSASLLGMLSSESGDYVSARMWYGLAAESGNVDSMVKLGQMCFTGKGGIKDSLLAATWFSQAADRGNAEAMFYLGACYIAGEGVNMDQNAGVSWMQKAARQGFTGAREFLQNNGWSW